MEAEPCQEPEPARGDEGAAVFELQPHRHLEKQLEVLRGELRVSHRGERHYTVPWGLYGGEASVSSESILTRADGSELVIPSKLDFTMVPGDRLDLWTTGGGGYGDPLERDPERVLADVLDGKVSAEAAAERYGVVVDRELDRGPDGRE